MGQLACSEENFVTDLKSSTEMAPAGSRSCHFPRWNPSPINPVEDELPKDSGSIRSLYSGGTSFILSHNPTPSPDLVLALILALVPTLPLAPVPTNELFKQFMKAYLESNQGPR